MKEVSRMSETVKLIIEIPRNEYEYTCNMTLHDRSIWDDAIRKGIPLDDVKAEIAEEICLTDNPYSGETKYTIEYSRLLEILDNIVKAESEEESK